MTTKTSLSRVALTAAACLIGGAAWAYPAQVSQDLNMRTGPGTNYQVLGVLPGGAVVDVEGCRGSWCRVDYNGREGWASGRFLGEVRQSRGPVYRDAPPVYRAPPPAYGYYDRAPPPAYGYVDRVRPAPGVTFEFGFGSSREYYEERDYRPRHPRSRHWRDGDYRGRDRGHYSEGRRIRLPDGTVIVRGD